MPTIICDRDNWQIRAVNDAAVSLYRYPTEHFQKLNFVDVHGSVELSAHATLKDNFETELALTTFMHASGDGEIIDVGLEGQPGEMRWSFQRDDFLARLEEFDRTTRRSTFAMR